MKATIKLIINRRCGTSPSVVVIKDLEVDISGNLTPHEIAGVLFASEFSINNHASEICGMAVRAHIDMEE